MIKPDWEYTDAIQEVVFRIWPNGQCDSRSTQDPELMRQIAEEGLVIADYVEPER